LKKLIIFYVTFLVAFTLLISLAGCACSPLTVVTVQANLITATSATLFGHLQYHGSADSVELFFQYGIADDALNDESEKDTLEEVRPGDFFQPIENLRPNTTYSFRAVAIADPGDPGHRKTDYGDILHFTTKSMEPLEAEDMEQETPEGEVTEQDGEEPIGEQEEEEEEQLPTEDGQEEPETATPIARWHFDEGSGTTAYDDINDNHGTLIGDTSWPVEGHPNDSGALAFDGDGDYVTIANEHNFDFDKEDAFTIEAWVKTTSDDSMNILYKGDISGGFYSLIKHASSQTQYEPLGDNKIYFFLVSKWDTTDEYANMDAIVVYGSTDITEDGEWHHIKVTYDGSNNASGIQIYVDDEPETMHTRTYGANKDIWDTISESGSIQNDLPLTIGDNWDGIIDEVTIWRGIH